MNFSNPIRVNFRKQSQKQLFDDPSEETQEPISSLDRSNLAEEER